MNCDRRQNETGAVLDSGCSFGLNTENEGFPFQQGSLSRLDGPGLGVKFFLAANKPPSYQTHHHETNLSS